jgi:putative PEP-CTERM system TPR-repeat lipoprotein
MVSIRRVGMHLLRTWTVASLALLLVACGGPAPEQRLARAEQALADGKVRAALVDLRAAVADAPSDPELRFRLGVTALLVDDAPTAEKELLRARELGYDAAPTVVPLCQAYQLLGKAKELLGEAAQVEQPGAELLALTGDAYLILERQDRAFGRYQEALAADPANVRALLGTARFAQVNGDNETAVRRLEAALAVAPEDPAVRLSYGRWLFSQQQLDEADAQFRAGLDASRAAQRPRFVRELRLALVDVQLRQGELDAAAGTVETVAEAAPGDPVVDYLRARVAFDRRDLEAANEYIARALVTAPNFDAAQLLQGAIYLSAGQYSQAELYLRAVVNKNPGNGQARKLLLAAEEGVQRQLAAADDGSRDPMTPDDADLSEPLPTQEIFALLAKANVQAGDYGSGLALFERALEEAPADSSVRLDLATGYLLGGRVEEAQRLLAEGNWAGEEDERRSLVLDALATLREGDYDAARAKAQAARERFPDDSNIASIAGVIYMTEQDDERAYEVFEGILARDPLHTNSVVNLARLDVRAGREAEAKQRLADFLQRKPDDAIALLTLGQVLANEGDTDGAIEYLQRASDADPGSAAPRQLLVRMLIDAGRAEEAESVGRELVTLRPDLAAGHNALGIAVAAQGRVAEAAESFRRAVRADAQSVEALRNLARAEVLLRQLSRATSTVDQLLRVVPEDEVGLELGARLALETGRREDAAELIGRLEAVNPGTPVLEWMYGDLAVIDGDLDEASRRYERSFQMQPTSQTVLRRFNVRLRQGVPSPEAVLEEWLADNPQDVAARMALAQQLQQTARPDGAIEQYEQLLAINASNVVAANNLAWLYASSGDDRALAVAAQAAQLAPDSPAVQDTYGWLQVLDGQLEEGIVTLRDAWQRAPGLVEIGYHLAEGLARSGDTEEALDVLEKVLGEPREFEERDEAERLMQRLKSESGS